MIARRRAHDELSSSLPPPWVTCHRREPFDVLGPFLKRLSNEQRKVR
jgi:hypothetical protein